MTSAGPRPLFGKTTSQTAAGGNLTRTARASILPLGLWPSSTSWASETEWCRACDETTLHSSPHGRQAPPAGRPADIRIYNPSLFAAEAASSSLARFFSASFSIALRLSANSVTIGTWKRRAERELLDEQMYKNKPHKHLVQLAWGGRLRTNGWEHDVNRARWPPAWLIEDGELRSYRDASVDGDYTRGTLNSSAGLACAA